MLTRLHGMGDVSEGQDLTLVCSVQRGTLPITFTWYRTETEGALATQTSMILEGSYNISIVRREHRGGYYCLSTNQANETKQSHTVMIGGVFLSSVDDGHGCDSCVSIFVRAN